MVFFGKCQADRRGFYATAVVAWQVATTEVAVHELCRKNVWDEVLPRGRGCGLSLLQQFG